MMRRSELKRTTALSPGTSPLKRTPLKRATGFLRGGKRRKKIAGHHDQKMLDACRGEPCYLHVAGVCLGKAGKDTVVPCHGNWPDTGKGLGLKAADRYSVPGCSACHYWLDFGTTASREEKRAVFFDALAWWEPARERKLNKERK